MTDALTELLKTGAQQLIATAVEAELVSYLAQFTSLRTDAGHAAVVRNEHHTARALQRFGPRRHTGDIPVCSGAALGGAHLRRVQRRP
jgi:hypothetical protein